MSRQPAFPVNKSEVLYPGMTLRDYFAAKAMAGTFTDARSVSYGGLNDRAIKYASIAEHSYAMADAMLAAREAK